MSSPTEPPVKAAKKSAFSCDQCRRRKVKCGGEQPSCDRCLSRRENCVYKLSPTLSYTQTLENRIRELEKLVGNTQIQYPSANHLPRPTTPTLSAPFKGLKVDECGAITYHGATSFFNLPNASTSLADEASVKATWGKSMSIDEGERRKEKLVHNAWQQRALEAFSETPEPFQFMLQIHWCWIQPLFNFVYRPAFTRDMEVLGPYYSHTLLNALLSHSVRWCKDNPQIRNLLIPYENGALFSRQARSLLFAEISMGHAKVPTVQTLLLLSAQECSAGNRTQAWLYSGMAFRLIEDMGICFDGQNIASAARLEDEDVEIRQRLFWSCYFWDKMVSLYLGRSPTLQHANVSPLEIIMDDSAEDELWRPHGIVYPEGAEYPSTKAHSISCFRRMCQLAVIFNQILIHVYDPVKQNSVDEVRSCLQSEGESLRQWWEDLPDYLKIDVQELPHYCPPSHIVTLNCLYYTFKVLLYRPMLFYRSSVHGDHQRPDPHHLLECISSATSIIAIFDLFCQTFGDEYCILSLSYSVYTAASIFLLQVQAEKTHDSQAMARLKFCTFALERLKASNPVIASALSLITAALSDMGVHLSTPSADEYSQPIGNSVPGHSSIHDDLIPQNNEFTPFENAHFGDPRMYHEAHLDTFNPDGFEISNEILEAYSYLKPIDATFGHDDDWDC